MPSGLAKQGSHEPCDSWWGRKLAHLSPHFRIELANCGCAKEINSLDQPVARGVVRKLGALQLIKGYHRGLQLWMNSTGDNYVCK